MINSLLKDAIERLLKNDVEIMCALSSIMYRQKSGNETSFESTHELLGAAVSKTNQVIGKLR